MFKLVLAFFSLLCCIAYVVVVLFIYVCPEDRHKVMQGLGKGHCKHCLTSAAFSLK